MSLRVDAVDAPSADDDTLLAIHRVEAASIDFLAPGEPWRSADDAIAFMRHQPADTPRPYWLASLDDEPAGMAMLYVAPSSPLLFTQIFVDPQFRRRGVGSALLAAVQAHGGFESLAGHYSAEDGRAFARAVGAREEQRDLRLVIDLHTAEVPAPSVPEGYTLRTWTDAAPEELVASFAEARNAVDDAPHPEGMVEPPWTVERVREFEATLARRDRQARVTAAIASDGTVASFTETRVSAEPSNQTTTEGTATLREHRGRGLALAVKAESLRRLRSDRPDVRFIPTYNAESNTAMRAINTKLGFVPVATLTTVILAAH